MQITSRLLYCFMSSFLKIFWKIASTGAKQVVFASLPSEIALAENANH